jgi:hypothetical protein
MKNVLVTVGTGCFGSNLADVKMEMKKSEVKKNVKMEEPKKY